MPYGITLPGGLVKVPRSGGSPALPVWTYTAGAVGDGQFTANQGDPASTTQLTFSELSKYGPTVFSAFFGAHIFTGATIYMTNSSGVSVVLQTTGSISGQNMPVEVLATAIGDTWSGDYQVFFIPPTNFTEALNASSISSVFTGNLTPITNAEISTGLIINAS